MKEYTNKGKKCVICNNNDAVAKLMCKSCYQTKRIYKKIKKKKVEIDELDNISQKEFNDKLIYFMNNKDKLRDFLNKK